MEPPPAGTSASSAGEDRISAVSSYWDVRAMEMQQGRDHWEGHPLVMAATAERRGGGDLAQCLIDRLPPGAARGAGLGVGAAGFELDLLQRDAIETLDLYDAGRALIASGTEAAVAAGLGDRARFHIADLNELELEPQAYDLVIWISSLHHVEALEHALEQCHRSLRPGGLLFAHEYVGPTRFAFPADHVELARTIYRTIDPVLRSPWPELPVPDPVEVARADPTEAVRSEEMIGLVRDRFPTLEVLSYEVCLTLIMWYGLNHDALFESRQGFDLVRWLLEVDSHLVRSGRLWSYQALLVARK